MARRGPPRCDPQADADRPRFASPSPHPAGM